MPKRASMSLDGVGEVFECDIESGKVDPVLLVRSLRERELIG